MEQKKRLTMVITGLSGGGAEKVFADLAEHLCSLWEIDIVLFERENEIYAEQIESCGIPIHTVSKSQGHLKLVRALRKKILSLRPDAVLSFLNYSNIISWLALRKTDIPLFVSEHNNYRKQLVGGGANRIKRMLLPYMYRSETVKAIGVVSSEVEDALHADFGPFTKPAVAILNGIDTRKLDFLSQGSLSPEEEMFFQQGDVITAVGRLSPQKNLPLLLNAFARIETQVPQARLLLIGVGEEQERLYELARELGIQEKIRWGGFLKNPHARVARSALYAMSSDFEGHPLALIEAMRTNGCCISTDCPTGPSEIIRHLESGYLAPLNDVEEYAQGLLLLLQDKELRQKIQREAFAWSETASFEKTAKQYHELLLLTVGALP